ncbi:MAG: DUF2020 domain-containing protein [Actinomycetota bacterium]|nr:DUF2020 domain-containing protein [Actinomycetota bacterium]
MSRGEQTCTRRPPLAVAIGVLVLLGSAGCSGDGGAEPTSSSTSRPASTEAAGTSPSAIGVTTAPAPPVVGPGPCPYLDETYIEETVGDRMSRVETITVEGQPAPDCVFYRLNGNASVAVDLTPYGDPVAAQNAALAQVTTAALPVTDVGDYGGVFVANGTTVLAVTSGALLVAVILDKESSLQAREIAATALAALPPL